MNSRESEWVVFYPLSAFKAIFRARTIYIFSSVMMVIIIMNKRNKQTNKKQEQGSENA